jgi:altronate hydrolase
MWLQLSPIDNVAVNAFVGELPAGTLVTLPRQQSFALRSSLPKGHKVAISNIRAGEPVIKFGHVIGVATSDILIGGHVHVHNVAMPDSVSANARNAWSHPASSVTQKDLPGTFNGYLRRDGSAGIRNYVVVVASVNCSASVVKAVCRHFQGQDLGTIHAVVPITHASGCAQAINGTGYELLNKTIGGWIYHPNVVAALVIGLGCEGTTFESIAASATERSLYGMTPVETFNIQQVGGTAQAIEEGIRRVHAILDQLPRFERTPLPVSLLRLALNCGGSDGFSSLTANPVVGVVSDILINQGGAVALGEIPECTGTEENLSLRCTNPEVLAKLKSTFAWWRQHAAIHHISLNENLAPGNIAGGITTIIEKSLGAVAKGGTGTLDGVIGYAAPITKPGLSLMNTPGFDPVSVTGLVAGGCQLVAFTTGRGSVYGCAIAPTVKISTTTALFERMSGDMDFDAGGVLQEGTPEASGQALYQRLVDVASGRQTCSELLGIGWEEFTPWPIGETL